MSHSRMNFIERMNRRKTVRFTRIEREDCDFRLTIDDYRRAPNRQSRLAWSWAAVLRFRRFFALPQVMYVQEQSNASRPSNTICIAARITARRRWTVSQ